MNQLSVKQRYERIIDMINQKVTDYPKKRTTIRILTDFLLEKIRYKTKMSDYIQYEYYKKPNYLRREFIDENRREIIHRIMNDPKDCELFNNKTEFNRVFTKYLGRDWFDTQNDTFENFRLFVEKHKKFFVKPAEGWFGIGAGICNVEDDSSLDQVWRELQEKKALLEECITQHHELSEFNPTSVNTLRIVTVLCPDNNVKIMTADLRLGRKGKVADNFHHNGIASLIDVDTGIIYTMGIDKNRRRYILHPDSKKQIIGFCIPFWKQIKETVREAALIIPTVRYVGWDIALGENGEVMIVEGNCMADPDVTQMPDGKGKWPMYVPILKAVEKSRGGKSK